MKPPSPPDLAVVSQPSPQVIEPSGGTGTRLLVASASEDACAGVVAAHRAVQQVLKELASFCADAAQNR